MQLPNTSWISSILAGKARLVSSVLALSASLLPGAAAAQEFRTIDPGTTLPVRITQAIDVNRHDDRVYTGIVDQDVRADNGRIAIPRGSTAELYVRVARDNDLVLDLESIVANGQRYAISAQPNRVQSNDLVGSIVGTLSGGAVRGRVVRIPRDSVINFRLERRLDVGVPDRGYDRGGWHYHGGRDNGNNRDLQDNRDYRR
jgi:hypothetical protein